ncbi:PhaM family polyhydroxyalkanoate granule multifunctional regulatory protein [Aromatoleum sp.]|uniref:PhaM family polyhydroxyalkanoate granule multifunctional regulatory protein n=1 Tax=Aromatoleum sp. TaxID=2307007 RepID=UPI002FC8B69E
MSKETPAADPLEFVRGMWNNMGFSLPGMVTPTLDVNELDKRIADLKAVENWLKMNLNMLQMTTQGLEMQRVALAAVQAMSQHARESGSADAQVDTNLFAAAAMWPWNLMTTPHGTEAPPAKPETRAEAKPARPASKPATEKK